MDFGLGMQLPKDKTFSSWTEAELSRELEAEYSRKFPSGGTNNWKSNTLSGWLHYDKIPQADNLGVLVAVLTDQERIKHADEWRRLFRNAARRRSREHNEFENDTEQTVVSIFPRGRYQGHDPETLRDFLSAHLGNKSDDHLRSHLSLDHALDVYETTPDRMPPDHATGEEALQMLLHRGFRSALAKHSLHQFFSGADRGFVYDEISAQELSFKLKTSIEPFDASSFGNLASHQTLKTLLHHGEKLGAQITPTGLEDAIFCEFFRHRGFYLSCLQELWLSHSDEVKLRAELQLRLHRAGIELEMRKSLFSTARFGSGETFSLADIYTPIPCIRLSQWEENLRALDDNTEFLDVQTVVDQFCSRSWRSAEVTDRVLVLRGDPGSGKTSMLKHLAWNVGNSIELRDTAILFVPFQKGVVFANGGALNLRAKSILGFSDQSEPIEISQLIKRSGFSKLLIFFDGLDELGSIGTHESQVRQFSQVIATQIQADALVPCKFIVSGRDQAFRPTEFDIDLYESSYRLVGLSQERIEPHRQDAYIEDQHISYYFDLRSEWLEKLCRYKSLHGNPLTAASLRTSIRGLDELSAEPLLLFLLSKLVFLMANRHKGVSFDLEGVFDISRPSGLTKNDIYSLLIASIRTPQHRESSQIDRPFREGGLPDGKAFEQVLGCMAVPTWHNGTGRRGTLRAFFDQAEKRNILAEARRFTTAAEQSDITMIDPEHLSLMSVFYFDTWDGDGHEGQEYEFTHKSFASYLIARELFAAAVNLAWVFSQRDVVAQENALENWLMLTKDGYEEPEVLRFLNLEIDRYNHPEGAKFLSNLGRIGSTAQQIRERDLDVDSDDFRLPFETMEEAGLLILAQMSTGETSSMLFQGYQRSLTMLFAIWTAFVRGVQRTASESYNLGLPDTEKTFRTLTTAVDANELDALYNVDAETSYFSESLSALNLEGYDLSGLNLINARLCNSNLSNGQVQLSALDWSVIEECSAEGLTFINCQLNSTRFFRTDAFVLVNCVMRHGLIDYCKFQGQLFDKSELTSTRLLNCSFQACEFRSISFEDASFENCNFTGCTFRQCNFDEAELVNVSFKDSSFELCSADNVKIGENVRFGKKSGFPKNT